MTTFSVRCLRPAGSRVSFGVDGFCICHAVRPPSMMSSLPVTKLDSSEAR
jgi:hypothetical protein